MRSPTLAHPEIRKQIEIDKHEFSKFYKSLVSKVVEYKEKNKTKKPKEKMNLLEHVVEEIAKLDICENEIYSQIFSVIKGSLSSHNSYTNCITREEYHKKGKKLTVLNDEQQDLIYDICILYEKYKLENNFFDIQDFKSNPSCSSSIIIWTH